MIFKLSYCQPEFVEGDFSSLTQLRHAQPDNRFHKLSQTVVFNIQSVLFIQLQFTNIYCRANRFNLHQIIFTIEAI